MKLWNYIKENALLHANQKICESEAEMSFEEVIIWAQLFAKKLEGVKCCAILCESEMAAAMSLLACFAAEVTAVPLSARYGQIHCNKILETISPDAIIMDGSGEIKIYKISDSQYITPEKHPALIMCTSGTTGKPKGVMLSEENIITNVTDIAAYFDLDQTDTILISRPLYHCAVLTGEFLLSLLKGAKIRFYSEPFNPPKMLELIEKYAITAFCGTPTLLSMMAKFNRKAESQLKHICISGECMRKEVALPIADAFPSAKIYHVYGLTEACPRVSYLPPVLFEKYPDFVGVPLNSVSLKIVNKEGKPCAPNEEGILWVKGKNVMLGYYQAPERTTKILKNGWLCTGDIAFINEKGLLKIKGRSDDLIIKSGMNIYPAEIEAALKQTERVQEVLVYGFENRFGVQIGMQIVGDFASTAEVKQLCMDVLPPFQIPTFIEIVTELPKNASGKIIRRKQV